MEMSEHKVFTFYKDENNDKVNFIVKQGQYEDGSAKLEIYNLRNSLIIEATTCCNKTGLDSNDAIINSEEKMPGLIKFLESHNIVKQQDEYINIGNDMFPVVKLLPETEWTTDDESRKMYLINGYSILAQDTHQAFQLYLFALQAEGETIEY
jgi:hypothetical protein